MMEWIYFKAKRQMTLWQAASLEELGKEKKAEYLVRQPTVLLKKIKNKITFNSTNTLQISIQCG